MGDISGHVSKEPVKCAGIISVLEFRVTHRRPDAQPVAAPGDRVQSRNSVDIDEMRGPREPKCHHRNEALAAGDDSALVRSRLR
jgi:hypothetical protein